ncbi:hypothetical protein [Mucilaginibacter pedocola]|uniref:DUF4919 domain-containing protein n=1 Tax=Mucilaginibacter pedocola TaxID=1792845 RepID=A0A1S9PAH5_9SPHI|nr:hypothetical protein [Mucilaginibacter pedocola]OOQ57983.1 hypothetical protein BC343_09945 [Mucilaginibacter pedocola]
MFNKTFLQITIAALCVGLLLPPERARAQSTDMIFENSATAMSGEATARDFYVFDFPSKKYPVTKTGKKAAVSSKTGSLLYTPTAALRQQTVASYAERTKATNPALSKAVSQAFAPGKADYSSVYQNIAGSFGLKANDAGDAVVANLILSYLIVNNLQGNRPVNVTQVSGVQAQFKPKLQSSAKLTAPGMAAQTGEEMKLQFVIQQAGWQSAIKSNRLAAFQQNVWQATKNNYAIDMRQVRLGVNGFERK